LNSAEITASITALANVIATQLNVDQLSLLGALLTMLGDVLQAIAAIRSLQETAQSSNQSATQETNNTADSKCDTASTEKKASESPQNTTPTETQSETSPPIT